MVTLVAKMIVEGFAQMMTVLHGGGEVFWDLQKWLCNLCAPPKKWFQSNNELCLLVGIIVMMAVNSGPATAIMSTLWTLGMALRFMHYHFTDFDSRTNITI